MHNWAEFELNSIEGWRERLSNMEWLCSLQGHKQEKQPRAGIARKSTREVDKAAECITATATCRNKYILFICRTKLAYEDLKSTSYMPDDAFILVRNRVHCHSSTETEAQVTRGFATGSAGRWWSLGMKQNQISPQLLPYTPISLP